MTLHTAIFSHEFDDGASGAARSYWKIKRERKEILTVCLHHRRDMDPALTVQSICYALDSAFQAGRSQKTREVRETLEIYK